MRRAFNIGTISRAATIFSAGKIWSSRAPNTLGARDLTFTEVDFHNLRGPSLSLRMTTVIELLATDSSSKARCGRLTTNHGLIETPAFMPVGTQGAVKAMSPRELDAQIILGNTYHLFVRPGLDVIRHFGLFHTQDHEGYRQEINTN
jgi:hypothetical protein